MDNSLTINGGDGEVLGNDMVGVGPGVGSVIDGVRIGEDRVTASVTMDKCRIGKGERNVIVTYGDVRSGRYEDVGSAMDDGD